MQDAHIPNLDDISKTSFYIPYNPPSRTQRPKDFVPKSYDEDRDLDDGRELRFVAYKDAWSKCLHRMQQIVRDLQAASVKDVVQEVHGSYSNILPGLPYAELPVISLTNSGLGSAVLDNITSELESDDPIYAGESAKCFLVHLYPGDVPNITSGMRSIISGLTEKEEIDPVKRKSATSLATYDMKYLVAWYGAWLESQDTPSKANFVVLLHDFEQFDPIIMQDIFEICSKYISELPLVFLLSMTSPVSNYLNLTYPRATLSLLRVRQFSAPAGGKILETLVFQTFFDPEFQTDIMIGPANLKYLQDYFTRYNLSVDAIFTVLQLAHLRHFSSDPITVLAVETSSIEILSTTSAFAFTESLANRIKAVSNEDFDAGELTGLVDFVDKARTNFKRRLYNMKLGLHVLLLIQSFLEDQSYNGIKWSLDSGKRSTLWDAMSGVLDGHSTRVMKDLRLIARKLKRDELRAILDRIYKYLNGLSVELSSTEDEQAAKSKTVEIRSLLAQCGEDDDTFVDAANIFSEWITRYLSAKLQPLDHYPLWDIWYTGQSPFPSEIINPSMRASLVAGLLQPHAFAEPLDSHSPNPVADSLRDLPDTSILFKRYLDSSKMINVYDWFESFKTVLDDQRQHFKNTASAPTSASPRKRGKGKQKVQPQADTSQEDDAKWDTHVQARFIRALHELDYLGLIKHTGRKADHLVRTLFDVDDAQ